VREIFCPFSFLRYAPPRLPPSLNLVHETTQSLYEAAIVRRAYYKDCESQIGIMRVHILVGRGSRVTKGKIKDKTLHSWLGQSTETTTVMIESASSVYIY